MEQLIFLLVIGAISLINWLIQKSAEAREKRKQEEARARRGDVSGSEVEEDEPFIFEQRDFDSDAARKLREALGLPDEAEVPPPIPRRQAPPAPSYQEPKPVPRATPAPPPIPNRSPAPVVSAPPAFIRALAKAAPTTVIIDEEGPDHPVLHRTPATPFAISTDSSAPSRVEKLLSSRSSLRDAVILSEILGPPRSMQSEFLG